MFVPLYNNNIFFYVYIMLYTYYGKGGTQKRVSAPVNSRPFNNKTTDLFVGSFGKPNPIKHWRKQLMPHYESNSTKITITDIENPSTSVYTDNLEHCNIIYDQLLSTNKCIGVDTEKGCVGGSHNIRRSGSTIYGPTYCSTTKQYLQRRCKTYEQNMMVGQVIDKEQNLYKSTICNNDDSKCVVYKRNNNTFNTIDSVVASNYVSKRKTDAMNRVPYNPNKKLEQACVTCYV
jgi:hypothetical protein